ncbi:hypothetical protein [Lactobacillus intestinalis]|uniref:hypothetical protein n=1 Tax=Lactobacillus intestinalis TaxID=151781 RepID=UPI002622B6FC|nr:hypothetical protein [Lactobacillus intestinalis]
MENISTLSDAELCDIVGGAKGKGTKRGKSKFGSTQCTMSVAAGMLIGSATTLSPWGGLAAGLTSAASNCF